MVVLYAIRSICTRSIDILLINARAQFHCKLFPKDVIDEFWVKLLAFIRSRQPCPDTMLPGRPNNISRLHLWWSMAMSTLPRSKMTPSFTPNTHAVE
mmetsp:Transcript_170679/g.414712  ORF Transcript_170679/g.414712 Transcript_170679/m.414712 type:complete len:97 (-) Transcript_170679:28-318(-)